MEAAEREALVPSVRFDPNPPREKVEAMREEDGDDAETEVVEEERAAADDDEEAEEEEDDDEEVPTGLAI
jgi:hypothetical protein